MTRPKDPRGSRKHHHQQAADHERAGRKHKKNPCGHAPAPPEDLSFEFVQREGGGRHNRWRMRIRWREVTSDIDGLPVLVKQYKVRVEYSANGVDWFVEDHITVPGRPDEDENEFVTKLVKGVRPRKLAYRFKVKAIEVNGCDSEWATSEEDTLSHGPPAPSNVTIRRRPHGIFLDWDEDVDDTDDDDGGELFTDEIDYYTAQLFRGADEGYSFPDWEAISTASDTIHLNGHGLNTDDLGMVRGKDLPNGLKIARLYFVVAVPDADHFQVSRDFGGTPETFGAGDGFWITGLYRWRRHLKKSQIRFHVDSADIDEDQKFYGRVRSVDDDGDKSLYIPATWEGNSDPDADPEGRSPKAIRRVMTFNIPGPMTEGTYDPPNRFDDDYVIRRVTGAAGTPGSGGSTNVDVVVKAGGGSYDSIFEDDTGDMLTFTAGDDDASTKAIHAGFRHVDRGDKCKIQVESIGGASPEDTTIHLILDRLN